MFLFEKEQPHRQSYEKTILFSIYYLLVLFNIPIPSLEKFLHKFIINYSWKSEHFQ